MRTTLVIDDELYVSVKKFAAEEGASVSSVVSEALRRFVGKCDRIGEATQFSMPTFAGIGPSVDTTPVEFHRLDEEFEISPFE